MRSLVPAEKLHDIWLKAICSKYWIFNHSAPDATPLSSPPEAKNGKAQEKKLEREDLVFGIYVTFFSLMQFIFLFQFLQQK